MCGIAAIATKGQSAELDLALSNMVRAISQRGPDDEGFYETSTVDGRFRLGLSPRRLAEIDLNKGHHPIGNEDGSIQIVFI